MRVQIKFWSVLDAILQMILYRFVGPALGLIFQQLFPYIPLCVPSQTLIVAQTAPNSKSFQRCSRSNINCIHSFQKVKFIAGCSYILYNVHSYVLVLDSVGQYIEVIFIFHNITWFWLVEIFCTQVTRFNVAMRLKCEGVFCNRTLTEGDVG